MKKQDKTIKELSLFSKNQLMMVLVDEESKLNAIEKKPKIDIKTKNIAKDIQFRIDCIKKIVGCGKMAVQTNIINECQNINSIDSISAEIRKCFFRKD